MYKRNIRVLLFNLRHVIHIPSFRIVNPLCGGGHFSCTTFFDAKTKYGSSYLLYVSQSYLLSHIRTSLGRHGGASSRRQWDTPLGFTDQTIWGHPRNVCRRRPQDVGRGRPLALHIEHGCVLKILHWDVVRTSHFSSKRTSVEDVGRRRRQGFIQNTMGASSGRYIGTLSRRHISSGRYIGTSFGDILNAYFLKN